LSFQGYTLRDNKMTTDEVIDMVKTRGSKDELLLMFLLTKQFLLYNKY